ncbi:hypothetical protein [Pantoea agglomerans]|uniref:hypothetical protein n=1 Tax=Enterobacter agglomerans TaxID=549 RepID=UPI003207C429
MEKIFMLKDNLSCISKERLQEINSASWEEGGCAPPNIGEVMLLSAIALLAMDLVTELNHE